MGYRNRGFRPRGPPRGEGGGFGFRPAPVELGKEYEADIVEMSHRGDAGVAKIQGFIIFVTGARVGQKVKFVITKVGRRYATAEIVKGAKAEETETEEAETEEAEESGEQEAEAEETEETEEEDSEEEDSEEEDSEEE